MSTKILIKRGSASQWSSSTTALSSGELGLDTTNNIIKVGDGSTLWNSLPGLTLTLTQVAELAQDALSTAFSNGTHSNIVVTYNDAGNAISLATGPDVVTTTSLNNTLTDPSSGYLQIADLSNKTGSGVAELVDGDLYIPSGNIIFEGATDNSYELTLSSPDVTSDITLNLPNSNGTLALTSDVTTAVANLVNSAPATLDTLNELATALGNDANFSTTVTNSIAGKVSKSGGDTITASTASTVGLIVKAAASQTADIQRWQDSSGNTIAKIGPLYGSNVFQFDPFSYGAGAGYSQILIGGRSITNEQRAGQSKFGVTTGEWALGALRATDNQVGAFAVSTTLPTFVVKGAASQTANLLEFQDSSGVVVGKYNSSYQMTVGSLQAAVGDVQARYGIYGGGTGYLGALSIVSWAANVPTAVFRGYASQTANLTEWQNSAGTVLAKVDASGIVTFKGVQISNGPAVTTGVSNIIIGNSNTGSTITSQNNNIMIGINAGIYNYGSDNIYIGTGSVVSGGAGSQNVWVGSGAGASTYGYSGNVLIGYQAGQSVAASNQLVIANSNTSSPLISGDFSVKTLNFAGNTTITSQATGTIGITIKGAASQTADLQQWQNSSGAVLSKITASGGLDITPSSGDTITLRNSSGGLTLWGGNSRYYMNTELQMTGGNWASGRLGIDTTGASNIGLVIRGTTSQTADLQQWQDSSGSVLTHINNIGRMTINSLTDAGGAALYVFQPNGGYGIRVQGAGTAGAAVWIDSVAGCVGQIIRGSASQTANLQEWQNSAGTVLSAISSTGTFSIGSSATTLNANLEAYGTEARLQVHYAGHSRGGIVALSSQRVAFYTTASGDNIIFGKSGTDTTAPSSGTFIEYMRIKNSDGTVGIGSTSPLARLDVRTNSASIIGLIIKGSASQTANLQEWQNSSGTVLVKVTSEGVMDAPLITNAQTVSYTLVAADSGKLVEINNASGVTLTIPTNASVAYAIGTQINILQTGAGQITIAGASGVIVNATPGLKLRAQWSSATLIKRGTDTWVAIGDLSA